MPMRKSNTLFVCYPDQFHLVANFPKSSPAKIFKDSFFERRLSNLNIGHIDRQTWLSVAWLWMGSGDSSARNKDDNSVMPRQKSKPWQMGEISLASANVQN